MTAQALKRIAGEGQEDPYILGMLMILACRHYR